jgi:hypothetical protein
MCVSMCVSMYVCLYVCIIIVLFVSIDLLCNNNIIILTCQSCDGRKRASTAVEKEMTSRTISLVKNQS